MRDDLLRVWCSIARFKNGAVVHFQIIVQHQKQPDQNDEQEYDEPQQEERARFSRRWPHALDGVVSMCDE